MYTYIRIGVILSMSLLSFSIARVSSIRARFPPSTLTTSTNISFSIKGYLKSCLDLSHALMIGHSKRCRNSSFSLVGRRNDRDTAMAVWKYYCCPRDNDPVYRMVLLIVEQIICELYTHSDMILDAKKGKV